LLPKDVLSTHLDGLKLDKKVSYLVTLNLVLIPPLDKMLESIAVNRRANPSIEQPFTVGHIAECLLFYGKVNAVISPAELTELIKNCSIETLTMLLSSQLLNLHLSLTSFGSHQSGLKRAGFGMFSQKGIDLQAAVYMAVKGVYRDSAKSLKAQDQLLPYIKQYNYSNDLVDGYLVDNKFSVTAFREVVKQIYPDYPIPLKLTFNLHQTEPKTQVEYVFNNHLVEVETNFNLDHFIRDMNKQGITGYNDFLTIYIMKVSGAIQDIDIASNFKSELSTEESNSPIVQKAILRLDDYKASNEGVITEFNEIVLDGLPSISMAIDSGMRSLDDFMYLFERSQKFKEWILNNPNDYSIVAEYLKASDAEAFTGGNFYKLLKFLYMAAPMAFNPLAIPGVEEAVNTGVNLVTGAAADTLSDLVFKRFDSWKPNQFVTKDLKPFLGGPRY
jgi:hypothetical protein